MQTSQKCQLAKCWSKVVRCRPECVADQNGGGDKPDVPPGFDQHELDQPQPEPQPDEGAGGGGLAQHEGGGRGGDGDGDGGQLDFIEPSRHWSRL